MADKNHEVYLDLGAPEEKYRNGHYILTVFHMVPTDPNANLANIAAEVAAESSTGTFLRVSTVTPFADSLNAKVYKIDEEKNLVWIAYHTRIFDRGGNIQNIMTYIAGNIYGMSTVKALKLLDVRFPRTFLENYDGPSYTLDDMRKYLDVYDRPILGTIIKPKIGLTAIEYAQVCYDYWTGGGDFVKNDEPQADQDFAPYGKLVKYVKEAMDAAVKKTGRKKVHSFNISAPDFDTMIQRAELIKSTFEPGSYAFLIDGITAGWMAVQTIRRRYPDVFIHFHRAGHGAYTRPENPFGFTVPVLTKMGRVAGASGIHTGTAGVGKMKGDVDDDIVAARLAVLNKAKGPFFEQDWSLTQEGSSKEYQVYMGKTAPIVSGGMNPLKLQEYAKLLGSVDFITTMGGGVHGHPRGTHAGAKAQLQAGEALQKGIDVYEYAKKPENKELAEAVKFFGKRK